MIIVSYGESGYPISDQFGSIHTYIAHIREYPFLREGEGVLKLKFAKTVRNFS